MKPRILDIDPGALNLAHTLTPGQSFRWKEDDLGRWTGVVRGKVIRIWREADSILYQIFPYEDNDDLIRDYFRLDVDLDQLYTRFAYSDHHIRNAITRFRGLRLLRQEPEETLLSYICSAANSVTRISASVDRMSREYGEFIANVDGFDYYSFPRAEVLAEVDVDGMAKSCNLGFRCANISSVAQALLDRSIDWLNALRQADYRDARDRLLGIRGVGRKIADCVLLFSLNKDEAVPVDTHIRSVATRLYLPEFMQKSLTPAVYEQIVGCFQEKFGEYAGWAQEYLFYDDLLQRTSGERETPCLKSMG